MAIIRFAVKKEKRKKNSLLMFLSASSTTISLSTQSPPDRRNKRNVEQHLNINHFRSIFKRVHDKTKVGFPFIDTKYPCWNCAPSQPLVPFQNSHKRRPHQDLASLSRLRSRRHFGSPCALGHSSFLLKRRTKRRSRVIAVFKSRKIHDRRTPRCKRATSGYRVGMTIQDILSLGVW